MIIQRGLNIFHLKKVLRRTPLSRYASNILVFNCGSSSIKYKVVNAEARTTEMQGNMDRLTTTDYEPAMKTILRSIQEKNLQIVAVGHRWVNGGEHFKESALISPSVERDLNGLISLAPLHNPHNLRGIQTAREAFPSIPHVAVFDTSFHMTIAEMIFLYPLPLTVSREHGLRKYGFHGTSYKYVCSQLQDILARKAEAPRERQVLVAHLGSGCSAAAITLSPCPASSVSASTSPLRAVCRDTTMGFTPLDGLMMSTRCGSIDASIIPRLAGALSMEQSDQDGLATVMDMLNKKSGLLGVSGVSADMRDVIAIAGEVPRDNSNEATERRQRCQLALDMFAHRAAREMIALTASLPAPVDCVVFTGGVGEKSGLVREKILSHMQSCCGGNIHLDTEANLRNQLQVTYSSSVVQVFVIPTDEELQIARETWSLCCVNAI